MITIEIAFANQTEADASRLADDLAQYLKENVDSIDVSTHSDSPAAMDFGATLGVILGAPASVILVRGIADWIRRQGDPDLVIKNGKRSVTVKAGLDLETKREIILAALNGPSD